MFDIIIINGAPELIPQLRYQLSKEGLLISCLNGIGNLTIAINEGAKGFDIKKSDMIEMTREIQSVLEKYCNVSNS